MSKYISCAATSVQLGSKRFPDRYEQPQIKAWRCDLTALSRSHNFYFVACNDTLHVYQPNFPEQSIPGEPELILHPPSSSPDLKPGIDYEDPHSITRLHVDYLGQDEIILVTCDDGDVIGYRTEEIQRVLDKRLESSDEENDFHLDDPVRTFLHRNVGASAWGLAIHREARMIAISANTHKVTVIAYALAQPTDLSAESSESEDSELEDCSDEEDPTDFPSPRRQDHVITLSARHNVPAVSFNNNSDDTVGRWLSGSSINGEATIWDLHHPEQSVRTIQLGFCASAKDPNRAPRLNPGSCGCLRPSNFPHAVWSTVFLDGSTAYKEPISGDLKLHSGHPQPYFQDMSGCKDRFGVRSHKALRPRIGAFPNKAVSDAESSEMEMSESESVVSDDSEALSLSSSEMAGTASGAVSDLLNGTGADELVQALVQQSDDTSDHFTDTGVNTNNPLVQPLSSSVPPPLQTSSNAINTFGGWFQPNTTTVVWDDNDDESGTDDELFVPSIAQAHIAFANAVRPTRAYCEVTTAFTLARQLSITSPFLIITKEDVHLYQRPLDYVGDNSDPIVTIRRPLHPSERNNPFHFITGSHDRHCYTTQIPELGVFIIASPNGRAGIFSLTKSTPQRSARPLYSFHLEYVLPFSNNDKDKIWDVDGARLIGVAAGPVQGMLDRPGDEGSGDEYAGKGPGSRRWRLMMYYTDHTVVAFELWKRRVGEMPEVGELIV